ncbi:MAG: hypothetical protein IKN84_03930 [Bacteroidales bacterium]|jgi:acyl-ACP thioesterase|nr:hypothetical protein [Bacteroidales bacterium]
MFYQEEITLSTLICDEDDKLTLWGLARLFQDVAEDHSESLGVGYWGLKPMLRAWILTRVYYNVLRLPTAGEKLTLRTWAKPDNGLIAPRDYQLIDAEGKICAASASNWVVLNMETRRVCRLGDIIKPYEKLNEHATSVEKFDKMHVDEDLPLIKHIDIPYSAIDHTHHVNNAEYMKWICDSIPEVCKQHDDPSRREIAEFDINYVKETKYDDPNVNLYGNVVHDGDTDEWQFRLTNSNGVAVLAQVKVKKNLL